MTKGDVDELGPTLSGPPRISRYVYPEVGATEGGATEGGTSNLPSSRAVVRKASMRSKTSESSDQGRTKGTPGGSLIPPARPVPSSINFSFPRTGMVKTFDPKAQPKASLPPQVGTQPARRSRDDSPSRADRIPIQSRYSTQPPSQTGGSASTSLRLIDPRATVTGPQLLGVPPGDGSGNSAAAPPTTATTQRCCRPWSNCCSLNQGDDETET